MPKVFLKISSLFVAVALCASFVCVPASAALALPGTTVSGSTGSGGSMLGDIEALAELTDLFDWLQDQEFEFVRMLKAKIDDDVCAFAPDKTSVHSFIRSYTLVDGVYGYHTICEYCSKSITELGSSAYSSYVSTLDSTTVSSSGTSSGDSSVPFDAVGVRVTHNGITLPPLPDVDFETYPYCLVRADSSSSQQYDVFYLQDEPKYFSMGQYIRGVTGLRYRIRYSDVATATEWSANGSLTNRNIGVASEWPIIWANVDIYDNSTGDLYLGGSASDSDTTVELPSADTRTSSLMQEINNYNIDNSYTDNSTVVNYYIGTVADDGSVSDIYNPGVYDEDTMVFTEPISGTQYQTTGWSYDYTERAYLLDLESGTMTVNGTDVAQVGVVYGDESVLIGYLDSSGDILSIDEFAYVMVSQSACNINGHTYTVETTKEASCVAAGERTYTCSNCGNQYAEDIPAVEHVYEYGVDREATCTTDGIILYTCTGCGTQYTESIPATGSHSYSYSIQTPATCTTPGVGLYECIYCGTSYTEEIASGGGHKYETCVIREVSCTKDGLVAYVCSECADEYTAVATAPGHFYEVTETVATEYDDSGAVVTIGYIVYECTTCGVSYTENDVVFGEGDSWLDWLGDLFKNIGSSIVNGLSNALEYVLETVIVTVTDWLTQLVEWAFDLFDGELVSQWFNWFSDDNPYFISDFGSDVDVWAYVPVFSGDDSDSSGGIVCNICGTTDCTTTHVWCAVCDKYDCGLIHTTCNICGTTGCTTTHVWCDNCSKYDCGLTHTTCNICGTTDCTTTHVWCAVCDKYDCGLDHEDNDDDSNSASDILDNELPIEWNSLEVANNSVKVDDESLPLVKVSDLMLTYAELSAASLSVSTPDGSCEVMPVYLENEAGHAAAVFVDDTADVTVVIISVLDTSAASSSFGVEFPETGLYALDLASLGADISFDFVLRMSDVTFYLTTPITDESVIFTYIALDTVFVMEKVSDDLLTRDELLNATLIYGEEIVPVSDWVSQLGDEIVVEDESGVHLDVFYIWVFSVSDPDALADEVVIPEPGLYLLSARLVDGVYESLGVALYVSR